MREFRKLMSDCRGVGAVEYALVASLISVAAIVAVETLGETVGNKYEQIDRKL